MLKMVKLKLFVKNRTQNLFGMDSTLTFVFLNQPINWLCNNVSNKSNSVENFLKIIYDKIYRFFF